MGVRWVLFGFLYGSSANAGVGGVIGPVIGGGFESPARNYPDSFFARIPIFQQFPYLLPCTIAAAFLATGALLATGLSWDGGPKRKRIELPVDKDEALQPVTDSGPVNTDTLLPSSREDAARSRSVSRSRVVSMHDPEAQVVARKASRVSMSVGGAHGYVHSHRPIHD